MAPGITHTLTTTAHTGIKRSETKMKLHRCTPFILITSALLISACASAPFNMEGINQSITPQQTIDNTALVNKKVIWGGLIIETRNFENTSQIELLNYPLSGNGEPITSAQPQGRFIIKYNGFLEPAQYASGRWLSAVGQVQKSKTGKIGDATYQYPILKASQIHIWPESSDSDVKTRFHFGIGIRL